MKQRVETQAECLLLYVVNRKLFTAQHSTKLHNGHFGA